MPDEQQTGGEANPEEGAAPNHDEVLEAALRERLGPDASLDTFENFVKGEKGWLRSHNEAQEALRNAEKEYVQRTAELAETTAQHQMATAQPQNPGQPQSLSDAELYQLFGATEPGEAASVGQVAGVFRSMESTFNQFSQAAGAALAQRDAELEELRGFKDELKPYMEAIHNNLAEQKINEIMDKYPRAYRPAVIEAMKNLPSGPDFENQLEQVAADSQKEIMQIGRQAALEEARERQKKSDRFRGEGGVAAVAGEEHPTPGTREFDKWFAERTFVPQDGGDNI